VAGDVGAGGLSGRMGFYPKGMVMSVVTNVILTAGCEIDGVLGQLNSNLESLGVKGGFVQVDQHAGNEKSVRNMECNVYVAAFNYTSTQLILDAVRAVAWRYPNQVQLLVRRQDEELFQMASSGVMFAALRKDGES
jgi:hypothetical protein